jgi:hypothetical protein
MTLTSIASTQFPLEPPAPQSNPPPHDLDGVVHAQLARLTMGRRNAEATSRSLVVTASKRAFE